MSSEVPPMFWFLFWVGPSVGVLSFGFFMAIIIHRGNMKALEILRAYAEKGIEPPPAVVELLTRQMGDEASAAEANARLTALTQGGSAAADIKKLRTAAGANCTMCHGK